MMRAALTLRVPRVWPDDKVPYELNYYLHLRTYLCPIYITCMVRGNRRAKKGINIEHPNDYGYRIRYVHEFFE